MERDQPVFTGLGYRGPEAAHGRPISLLENADVITVASIMGEISVALSDEDLAERKKNWAGPLERIYATSALWKYAQRVVV
ncbi:dihydroxy-acid dehydratase [Tropicimonas sp. TH_r6]|uniref:dihydroxy-acid dehydratase domain-containing protein n=1 Tax=Tropicimonas sp. TH_r6 TaxID=3082085 RepID=UPI002953A68B|nr:dihydroxy-acid dehydratase [Tropicimonas sp. TH_r6]MDV7141334.1 dihydroxy-acid dehydratase [Tropicimonas sp. TH_r6]